MTDHSAPPAQNHRLLVIDDNVAIHEDFKKIFASSEENAAFEDAEAALFGNAPVPAMREQFVIDSAFQGEEGLARVVAACQEGRSYAMAFVDVRMPPGWDGIETVERLWQADPDLQVVICTAYSDYSWDEMVGKLGTSDRLLLLKKPFDTAEVLQLAHALTAKWRLTRQVRHQIENLEELIAARTAALHQSEAHFRFIAENVADLIAVFDTQSASVYHSPSFEKVLGLSSPELGRDLTIHIHPEDRENVVLAIRNTIETGNDGMLEFRMRHRDGSWRVLEAHANPARDAQGKIEQLVMVARDITQRRQEEEERRQMEVQLRHAQKMESIGQLAAGIAHEINTPTQYISDNTHFVQDAFRDLARLVESYQSLLEAVKTGAAANDLATAAEELAGAIDLEYLSEEVPKAIEQSLTGLGQVSKIVGAMKEFSHPGSKDKVATDINRAIDSTSVVATNEWKYVADVVTDLAPDLPLVPCLAGEFNQVILNLIINASHAISDVVGDGSNGKGTITIATRQDGEWAEIRVQDTGSGIPESIRSKIFDPFFTTKGVGRGTGQGLAIAHSVIVDKHRGTIDVESEVGKGTTFVIRLPLVAASTEKEAA